MFNAYSCQSIYTLFTFQAPGSGPKFKFSSLAFKLMDCQATDSDYHQYLTSNYLCNPLCIDPDEKKNIINYRNVMSSVLAFGLVQ